MGAAKYIAGLGLLLYSVLPVKAQGLLNLGYDKNTQKSFLELSTKNSFFKTQQYDKGLESYKNTFLDFDIFGINPMADYTLKKNSGQNTTEKIKSYLGGLKLTPKHLTLEASIRKETNKTKNVESSSSSEHNVGTNPNYDLWTYVTTKADTNVTTTSSLESLFGEFDFPLGKFISIGPFVSYAKNKTNIDGISVVESNVTVTGTIFGADYNPDPIYTKTTTPIKSNTKSYQKTIGLTLKPGSHTINFWRSYNENKWNDFLKWDAYLAFKLDTISTLINAEYLGTEDSKIELSLFIPANSNSADLNQLAEFQQNKDKLNKSVSLNTLQKEAETRHLEKKFTHNNLSDHLKIFLVMNKSNSVLKPGFGIGYIGKRGNIELMMDEDNVTTDIEFKNIGISVTKPNNKEEKLSGSIYLFLPFK